MREMGRRRKGFTSRAAWGLTKGEKKKDSLANTRGQEEKTAHITPIRNERRLGCALLAGKRKTKRHGNERRKKKPGVEVRKAEAGSRTTGGRESHYGELVTKPRASREGKEKKRSYVWSKHPLDMKKRGRKRDFTSMLYGADQ